MSGDRTILLTILAAVAASEPASWLALPPDTYGRVMRGDEKRVVEAFGAWLERDGWSVQYEVAWADVVAEREGAVIVAEAKGRTAAPGLDLDTLYGQLLRRMNDRPPGTRFAVVVPDEMRQAALRVPDAVREALAIDVYTVDAVGTVRRH